MASPRFPRQLLVLLSLLLILQESRVLAQTYTITCSTSSNVIQLGVNQGRGLTAEQEVLADDVTNSSTISVRECGCTTNVWHTNFYCPQETEFCSFEYGIPGSVVCYQDDRTIDILRGLWLVALLWFPAVLVFLLFTFRAWHAARYCLSWAFPTMDTSSAEHLVQNPDIILLRPYKMLLNRLQALNLVAFYIRTTIYHVEKSEDSSGREVEGQVAKNEDSNGDCKQEELGKNSRSRQQEEDSNGSTKDNSDVEEQQSVNANVSLDDENVDSSSICIGALEQGDRIAKLQCPHLFHVDCIKSWCERKNACPLCEMQVATPAAQYTKRGNEISLQSGGRDGGGHGTNSNDNGPPPSR